MKKALFALLAMVTLSACQTTTANLRPGEIMGTDIGSILAHEAGLSLNRADEDKMNAEIDKALYFSDDGLTTQWYAGLSARIRPIAIVQDRRDRECRRFRQGFLIDNNWYNATAIACREQNVAWYLIANRWDRRFGPGNNRQTSPSSVKHGNWDNLSEDLSNNPARTSADDFGPQGARNW